MASNGFALVGAHEVLTCENCHSEPGFGVPFDPAGQEDCISCHAPEYEDEHAGTGFPTTCLTCHNTTMWEGAVFEHTVSSGGFGLVGAHEALNCESCHSGPNFEVPFTPTDQNDCLSCHGQDYDEQHAGTGFPTTCLTCHNTTTWGGAVFDHATQANGFALVGSHEALNCESCHAGPNFEVPFTPAGQNDCISCHAQDYEDEHANTSIPTTCLTCHNPNSWGEVDVDHAAVSGGFNLVGAHAPLACESCHSGPNFSVPTDPSNQNDCMVCHASDYNREHANTGFPTTCLTCHNVNNWDDTNFDHASVSGGFGLVGAHAPLTCESCHSGPNFSVPTNPSNQNDCISCHASDYNREHAGTNFPRNCLTCHNTSRWEGATFNHRSVSGGFGLVGAHNRIACQQCHSGPNFSVPYNPSNQNDCYACHASDYNREHAGSGFPTTCLTCHNTNDWDDASSLNHDAQFFPIYSGEHRGAWNECRDCHTSAPASYSVFSCLNCHAHRRSEMDDEHDDVGGYVYQSNACLSCHPDGDD